MLHLGVIICAKMKVKVSVYFVINIFSFILNIVSTKAKHKNENRKIDFDALYLQEIKRVGQSFYTVDNFCSLILSDNIVIYLSLVIIYGNLLKYITVTVHLLQ